MSLDQAEVGAHLFVVHLEYHHVAFEQNPTGRDLGLVLYGLRSARKQASIDALCARQEDRLQGLGLGLDHIDHRALLLERDTKNGRSTRLNQFDVLSRDLLVELFVRQSHESTSRRGAAESRLRPVHRMDTDRTHGVQSEAAAGMLRECRW